MDHHKNIRVQWNEDFNRFLSWTNGSMCTFNVSFYYTRSVFTSSFTIDLHWRKTDVIHFYWIKHYTLTVRFPNYLWCIFIVNDSTYDFWKFCWTMKLGDVGAYQWFTITIFHCRTVFCFLKMVSHSIDCFCV